MLPSVQGTEAALFLPHLSGHLRILFLAENYFNFYGTYLRSHPEHQRRTFRQQSALLFRQSFYQSDSYAWALRSAGHIAATVVPGCAELQAAWARERGLPVADGEPGTVDVEASLRPGGWLADVLLDQVHAFRPDAVYCFSGIPLGAPLFDCIRDTARSLVLQWSCPVLPAFPYESFDMILSSAPQLVQHFRDRGIPSSYLQHAFDERIVGRLPAASVEPGAAFVGSISAIHGERQRFLEALAGKAPFRVYGPGCNRLPEDSMLRVRHCGEAWGLDYYRAIARHRIALHFAGDLGVEYAGAKRIFEVTGIGSLLLAADQPGLSDCFDIGREALAFRDIDECAALIQELTADDPRAARIAAAGQERTLREHSFGRLGPELAWTLRALVQ